MEKKENSCESDAVRDKRPPRKLSERLRTDFGGFVKKRMALAGDAVRFLIARIGSAARVIWSAYIKGRKEPEIIEGTDFGRIRTSPDQVVKRVANVEELKAILTEGYAEDRPMAIAGPRHSSNGQTLAPAQGWQIRPDRDSGEWPQPRLREDGLVEVSGVHAWRTLHTFLRSNGLSAPVLTDHLGTAIAGTLSVGGGIGTASIRSGRQLDSVQTFSLVLPTGEEIWASRDKNPDLFRNALGGLGQFGVINQVVIKPVPFKPHLAVYRFQAETLTEAGDLVHQAICAPDRPENLSHFVLEGPILNTPYVQFEFGFDFDDRSQARAFAKSLPDCLLHAWKNKRCTLRKVVDADQSNTRHSRSSAYVASFVGYEHLWNDHFFNDYESYRAFVIFLEEEIFPEYGNKYLMAGLAFVYPSDIRDPIDLKHRRAAFSYPLTPSAEPYRWSFGLNYSAPPGPKAERIKDALRKVQAKAIELGGGLYPYGFSDRTAEDFQRTYGNVLQDFAQTKARVDPKLLLGRDVVPGLAQEVERLRGQ